MQQFNVMTDPVRPFVIFQLAFIQILPAGKQGARKHDHPHTDAKKPDGILYATELLITAR